MIGGVSRYYQHLIELLPQENIWVLDNEHHALLSQTRWVSPRWLKAVWSTWKAVTQHNIEHILVGQVLPLGTVALILRLLRHIPYTVMTHAMDITVPLNPQSPKRKQFMLRLILRHAASVTTVSRFTKDKILGIGVPNERIHIIHPCPHINGTVPSKTIPNISNQHTAVTVAADKKILLSVGRVIERKGFDTVIRALRRVQEIVPHTQYVIVGEGPYKKTLQSITEQLGLQDAVTFVGQCTDQELRAWYQRCDLFIMPSRELANSDTEGFGIVYVEASSFGKPVIGSTSGGISDAVVDGHTGFIVDPDDIAMTADACTRLLTNEVLAKQLGSNGQQRVQKIFQWKVQAEQLSQLLTRL